MKNNCFTLVCNAGRSGSSFLYYALRASAGREFAVYHEMIPVQVSLPKEHNRAYTMERIEEVLADKRLREYLSRWEKQLETQSIVECGWTACHLLPVLHYLFSDRLQVIVLHRDPAATACSRANMGNYHRRTFYDREHEVSPYDPRSIAPDFQRVWAKMNHLEKCLFWWYVVYMEAKEAERILGAQVPFTWIGSAELFSGDAISKVESIIGLSISKSAVKSAPHNVVSQSMRESFPVNKEIDSITNHELIWSFAETLGYSLPCQERIDSLKEKYTIPPGVGPRFRSAIGYWHLRESLKQLVLGSKTPLDRHAERTAAMEGKI